jgi:DNA-binding XRE family transcriptional regulator
MTPDQIRETRRSKGMTQAQLAHAVGLSRSHLYVLENAAKYQDRITAVLTRTPDKCAVCQRPHIG